jgi:lysophospholipase L1-like esterase
MRTILVIVFFLLVISTISVCAQKKVLIVGDSWAETIWRARALDAVLQENGFPAGLTEGGEGDGKNGNLTAIGGSRAEQWARSHRDWQLRIKSILSQNPSISVIHLVIGGNDILKIASKNNVMSFSPLLREHQWDSIKNNIQALVDYCLSLNPDLRVLLCDYDYLNIENAGKIYGFDFGGMSQRQLNEAFAEMGLKKMAIANSTDRCFYLENWGVLDEYYNNQQNGQHGPFLYPHGDINSAMPAKADIGDGIHPNVEAHKVILRRAVNLFYKKYLD